MTASATRRSKRARVMTGFTADRLGDLRPIVVAVIAHGALVAERLGPADPSPMEDLHVRGQRPHRRRQCATELRFDGLGIVAFSDADPVRDTEDVAVNRQSWNPEGVAEH